MALNYFHFDCSTTFLLYVYLKLVKKDALDSEAVYRNIIACRMYIGFMVNMGTMITTNLLLAKDLNEEVTSDLAVFWTFLIIVIGCQNLVRLIFCWIISKITHKRTKIHLSKPGHMFSMLYRIEDMLVDTVLFTVCLRLSDFKWTQFMIVPSVFYGIEMLTCIIVLGISLRNYRSIQSNENVTQTSVIEVSNYKKI